MAKLTNTGAGARGVNVKASTDKDAKVASTTWVEPGQTVEIDEALIADKTVHDDLQKGDAAAKKAAEDAAKAATPAA